MPQNSPDILEGSNSDAFFAEMRGLSSTVSARFDGFEREQILIKEWLTRMSAGIESMTKTLANQGALESRLGHAEGEASDLRLDYASMQADITNLREANVKTSLVRDGGLALVTAVVTGLFMKFTGVVG